MNKTINIKDPKSINYIAEFKNKKYAPTDIKITNVHLKRLNKIVGFELFKKNDLYIDSMTLYEIMQPLGNKGTHNYHNLTPEDIFYALGGLDNPKIVYKDRSDRFAIVPIYISSVKELLIVIIEVGARLKNDMNANINKIVTIYPKSKIKEMIDKMDEADILFRKEK